MLAKLLVAGLVIFEMLGVSILKLKSLQDSEMKRIKIVAMSHIPPLLQHYDLNANRSPKKFYENLITAYLRAAAEFVVPVVVMIAQPALKIDQRNRLGSM